jgi:hypothetical protein
METPEKKNHAELFSGLVNVYLGATRNAGQKTQDWGRRATGELALP